MPLHLLCTSCDFTHPCLPAAKKKCSHPSFKFFVLESKIIHDWHAMIPPSVTSCKQNFKRILVKSYFSCKLHLCCREFTNNCWNSITVGDGHPTLGRADTLTGDHNQYWPRIRYDCYNVCTIVEKPLDGKFYFVPQTFIPCRPSFLFSCTLYSKRYFSVIMILWHLLVRPLNPPFQPQLMMSHVKQPSRYLVSILMLKSTK